MVTARQRLVERVSRNIAPGTLEWIGLRPGHRQEMYTPENAEAVAGRGLMGDRRCDASPGSARQVSMINAEHIRAVTDILGLPAIDPAKLRRNLVVSGINLLALRHQRFSIGTVLFEATCLCHPCSRMDEALGTGGHAAMLGHGGICAKIIEGGLLSIGDFVVRVD